MPSVARIYSVRERFLHAQPATAEHLPQRTRNIWGGPVDEAVDSTGRVIIGLAPASTQQNQRARPTLLGLFPITRSRAAVSICRCVATLPDAGPNTTPRAPTNLLPWARTPTPRRARPRRCQIGKSMLCLHSGHLPQQQKADGCSSCPIVRQLAAAAPCTHVSMQ